MGISIQFLTNKGTFPDAGTLFNQDLRHLIAHGELRLAQKMFKVLACS